MVKRASPVFLLIFTLRSSAYLAVSLAAVAQFRLSCAGALAIDVGHGGPRLFCAVALILNLIVLDLNTVCDVISGLYCILEVLKCAQC